MSHTNALNCIVLSHKCFLLCREDYCKVVILGPILTGENPSFHPMSGLFKNISHGNAEILYDLLEDYQNTLCQREDEKAAHYLNRNLFSFEKESSLFVVDQKSENPETKIVKKYFSS